MPTIRSLSHLRSLGRVAVTAFFTLIGPVAAQSPPPNPLGQPLLDSSGNVREDAFIRVPLLPEDARYGDIQGQRLKDILLEVDAISLADRTSGNLFWGRNVGTAGHEATQDWIEGYFRANGLEDIHRQAFDLGPQWSLESWDVTFPSDGGTFRLESARRPQVDRRHPALTEKAWWEGR